MYQKFKKLNLIASIKSQKYPISVLFEIWNFFHKNLILLFNLLFLMESLYNFETHKKTNSTKDEKSTKSEQKYVHNFGTF